MSERKKHIAVLKEMLAWMNMSSEIIEKDAPFFRVHEHRKKAVKYAISSLETDEAYQLKYESTTKNDLGVDCISRADARSLICNTDIKHHMSGMSRKVFKDLYNGMDELPSVTPIRPKGHWIKIGDRGFGYSDIVICKCSECEYQTEFVGKFDGYNLVIDAEYADNYCSNCGADMRGTEE